MDRFDGLYAVYEITPECRFVTDLILRPEEQKLLGMMNPKTEYSEEALAELVKQVLRDISGNCNGNPGQGDDQDKEYCQSIEHSKESMTVRSLFHRGVISKTSDGERYVTGTFYGRLDIFATEEGDVYESLSREERKTLDDWYFSEYVKWLRSLCAERPTDDKVVTMEETLAFIDGRDDTPYLAICDCRRLRQGVREEKCGHEVNCCITYRTAPNSFVKRGLVQPITKEKAREIVISCHKEGLMQVINAGGICNCCAACGNCCCYLYRAAYDMNTLGVWPEVTRVVKLDGAKCIGCRKCLTRCQFNCLAEDEEGAIHLQNTERCQGCGLCVTTCPTDALSLENRK